jgi:tRNA(Ile2) C34 agmatinyltransferase TiaS
MTKRIDNIVIIEEEEPDFCEYCGKLAELRPYGKNGARICFNCGIKNREETNKNMERILFEREKH